MAIVVIDLSGNGIETGMRDMRQWLDAKRIEPSTFTYRGADAIAEVDFKTLHDAEAFAGQFGGRLVSS